jgi:hypothetical protein
MLELPVVAKLDEKNGIIDGRDYAMKCIMLAYEVLGAYAGGDKETFWKLRKSTHYLAQMEIYMRYEDEPNDDMVPHLYRTLEEYPGTLTERWDNHLKDTAEQTKALVKMADAIS